MKQSISIFAIIIILISPVKTLCAQWNPNDPASTTAVLSLAVTADGSKLLAGSQGEGFYFSMDNGTQWTAANTSLGGTIVRSVLVSGSDIYVGTEAGVYHTQSTTLGTGAWEGWSARNSGLNELDVLALAVSPDATKLFAGTVNGVYYSSNNGATWTAVNNGLTSSYVTALALSGTTLFATTLGGVYRSTNYGTTWTPANTGLTNLNVYTIAVKGSNIFIGTDEGVHISSNNGATWSTSNTGLTSVDVNCLLATSDRLVVGTFSGGVFISTDNAATWQTVNANLTGAYVNALAINGSNLFVGTSNVTMVNSAPPGGDTMPIELTSFKATINKRSVSLCWKTASEVNNYGFEVERRSQSAPSSTTGTQTQNQMNAGWEKIGFIEGHGSTNTPQSYTFNDNTASGTVSYRLKQVDRDGKYKYSQEIEASVIVPAAFALSQNYPNPFNPSTTMLFTVPVNGRAILKIFNAIGQEVATLFDGEAEQGKYHQVQFHASNLASGIYFSRLEYDGKVQIKKMQLLK